LAFHPSNLVLASCAEDRHIRFFDITRGASKRSFRYIADTYPVYSIDFHPSGQFLVAGTAHANIRMYDVHTFKCFTTSGNGNSGEYQAFGSHPGASTSGTAGISAGSVGSSSGGVPISSTANQAVTRVKMTADGRMFATASADGNIRLWDATNGRCISVWRAAHNGHNITSLQWAKSGAYLLSCGEDATVRLWEATSGRTLKAYYGVSPSTDSNLQGMESCPKGIHVLSTVATFSWDERHVLSTDPATNRVITWDSLSGDIVAQWDSQHKAGTTRIVASPQSPSMFTYGYVST
jgi:cleavage stimulation factor subunit 1